ncbi:MAG: acyl-CoA dehydrogenase family protein [Thermoplasmata archaeon]
MVFEITPEQKMLRDMIRDFCRKEIAPIAAEIDREERFPAETVKKMQELGLFGIPIAEEWGGVGAGYVAYCLAIEEIGKWCTSHAVIVGAHTSLVACPIERFGTDEHKEKYLRKLAGGPYIGAFALTEPEAGSDAANIKTSAVKEGDEYVLNGTKIWITNANVADIIIVLAVTDPALGARGGVTAFLVEKGYDGLSVGAVEKKMGIRGSTTAQLTFENCRVPETNVLGNVGEGFVVAMETLDLGRAVLGAGCVGGATAALEASVDFAKERVQFGEPVAQKQAIQFKIADIATELHAARLMVYDLAERIDSGERVTRRSAMVKLFCSEMLHRAVNQALQIHGGMGYMQELPIERMYRDARIAEIFEGTSEIQRWIIADDILRRGVEL